MENRENFNTVRLLPRYFAKIGLGVIIAGGLMMAITKIYKAGIEPASIPLIKDLLPNFFLLGLFFIAWSKDKIEDELTLLIRLKAMSWAFGWGILYVGLGPFVDLLLFDDYRIIGSRHIIFSMLLVYLIIHFLNTRSRS